eukprot:symbB.v1.2.029860.t1/scaffold3312.1/size59238/5
MIKKLGSWDEDRGEDAITWPEVSDEAAVGIWEVWWKQELAAGNTWSTLVKVIAGCEIPAVLLKAMQAVRQAEAADSLTMLAEAAAAAVDSGIALAILQDFWFCR